MRVEDPPLVTGTGRFLADIVPSETLYAAFVRSPVAHARILSLDMMDARESDGVVGVLGPGDFNIGDIPSVTGRGPVNEAMTRPVLARDKVRHVGEPMAIVVARDRATAEAAVEEVQYDLEELEVVGDIHKAASTETLLFEDAGTNVVHNDTVSTPGSREAGEDEVEVTVTVLNPRLAPVPIEGLGIVADPNPDGRIHVWCGHQAPHRLRRQLAGLLGVDISALRVTVPDVGGAFGSKGALYPEYAVVVATACRLEQPVSWIEGRREHFQSEIHGRGSEHRVTIIGDHNGKIRRLSTEVIGDAGAYPHNGSRIPLNSAFVASGPYKIPEIETDTTIVVTNRAPTGSYRGAGRPEATLSLEVAVEAYARRIGADPYQIRRRNLLRPEDLPYHSPTGAIYDSGDYPKALQMAQDAMAELVSSLAPPETGWLRGEGIAPYVERAGGAADSAEYGRVTARDDGRIEVRTGSTSSGQGHRTAWSQVAASVFGVDPTQVDVISGDTDLVADGVGSYASRSTQVGASAVWRTANQVRDQLAHAVADLWEVSADDLEFRNGRVGVKGVPDHNMTFAEAVELALRAGFKADYEELYSPRAQTFPYGVHGAVVDIELETGRVEVVGMVAVDDCGNLINPMLVLGQVHGSIMQGLGQALYEEFVYDDAGQPLTSTLMSYSLPGAAVRLPLVVQHLVTPAPSNPLGAKGTGEVGCIGMPAAILNAATTALAPLGVESLNLPLTPAAVWEALAMAKGTP